MKDWRTYKRMLEYVCENKIATLAKKQDYIAVLYMNGSDIFDTDKLVKTSREAIEKMNFGDAQNRISQRVRQVLFTELQSEDITAFEVYAILLDFSKHPFFFKCAGFKRFMDFVQSLGIDQRTFKELESMSLEYRDKRQKSIVCLVNAMNLLETPFADVRIDLSSRIGKIIEKTRRDYLPKEEKQETCDPLDEEVSCIENDNDHCNWNTQEQKEGSVVVEQKLDDTQKLIGVKIGTRIKYLVVASDFDACHAPEIYTMLVREELKIGKNLTTDRLGRIIEIGQLIDAGLSIGDIATYFDISKSMVRNDKRELRQLELLAQNTKGVMKND